MEAALEAGEEVVSEVSGSRVMENQWVETNHPTSKSKRNDGVWPGAQPCAQPYRITENVNKPESFPLSGHPLRFLVSLLHEEGSDSYDLQLNPTQIG